MSAFRSLLLVITYPDRPGSLQPEKVAALTWGAREARGRPYHDKAFRAAFSAMLPVLTLRLGLVPKYLTGYSAKLTKPGARVQAHSQGFIKMFGKWKKYVSHPLCDMASQFNFPLNKELVY